MNQGYRPVHLADNESMMMGNALIPSVVIRNPRQETNQLTSQTEQPRRLKNHQFLESISPAERRLYRHYATRREHVCSKPCKEEQ